MRHLLWGGALVRNILVLAAIVLSAAAVFGQRPPLLPTFRATTIHSPEGAEIFVRLVPIRVQLLQNGLFQQRVHAKRQDENVTPSARDRGASIG